MYRIGQSIDIHRLVEGRKLILGGEQIEYNLGLLGHSDADVLTHAIIESIIGALGLGDIGTHFSDKDEQYKDISSLVLLKKTYNMMNERGYEISNLDSIIIIEKPKMAPHMDNMKKNIANILHCDISKINIKATRGEKLGYIGRCEGVQAQSIVLLKRKDINNG